ncbi:MAG: hypothetical protein H0T82_04730 [Sphingomonas sp.]|nr:hypothetical protein [Sphingomonas sp.]
MNSGSEGLELGDRLWNLRLAGLGIVAFVIFSIALEDEHGIPLDTSYRVVCAIACPIIMFKLASDYAEERWLRTSLCVALLVNVALFFTPLVDRPTSRGEVMLFALPDLIILLTARIASYPVVDDHQRAIRQQMILALIVAVVFCVAVFSFALVERNLPSDPSGFPLASWTGLGR